MVMVMVIASFVIVCLVSNDKKKDSDIIRMIPVSTLTCLSVHPPIVSISIGRYGRLNTLIQTQNAFHVHVLASTQHDIAAGLRRAHGRIKHSKTKHEDVCETDTTNPLNAGMKHESKSNHRHPHPHSHSHLHLHPHSHSHLHPHPHPHPILILSPRMSIPPFSLYLKPPTSPSSFPFSFYSLCPSRSLSPPQIPSLYLSQSPSPSHCL